VVPYQNKIILKNFSINIHEAVLQPIAAFVYCNSRQQQTVAGRQKMEISTRRRRLRNKTPPMGGVSLKLFYDATTHEIK